VGRLSDLLASAAGFDWDESNTQKNWEKHRVAYYEAEEVFFNEPLIARSDGRHSSETERRYFALGQTDRARLLFVAFTFRGDRIRVISVREMNRNERAIYGE